MTNNYTYTVTEVADLLGIGRNAAYTAVAVGQIPSLRIGNSIRVPKAALDEMLARVPEIKEATKAVQSTTDLSAEIYQLRLENKRLQKVIKKIRKALG